MNTVTNALELGVSRYGSVASDPSGACAVLRAKAMAHGLGLLPASRLDLVAATVAADAWMLVLGAEGLERPIQHGSAAVRSLAAVLSRAAGRAQGDELPVVSEHCAADPVLISAAESHGRWCQTQLGPAAPSALRRAAADLAAAGPESRLSAYAELLTIVADGIEHPHLFG